MKGKKIVISVIVMIAILAAIYAGGMIFFASHYTYGTFIGGQNCSFKEKNSIYKRFQKQPIEFILVLNGRDDISIDIDSKAIVLDTSKDLSGLENYKGNILEGYGWIGKSLHKTIIDVPVSIDIDEKQFISILSNSVMNDKAGRKRPQNAHLGKYNSKTGQFEIVAGDEGNILSSERTLMMVRNTLKEIDAGTDRVIVNLDDGDCYEHALMSVNNAKLLKECDKANKMVSTKITYDWYGNWDVIDANIIKDWIIVDGCEVTLDESKVRSYIERSAGYYDTYDKDMLFRTTAGSVKNIKRTNYGWLTDIDAEVKELVKCINEGGDIIREPKYIHAGYAKGNDDIGDSYVEIDLSNQHLYLYVNGRCTLDTDFVSGNLSAGHKTPEGIYGVTYKTQNAVLRGPGYESFVYYWMPYNGGVGMHDATWRNKFGGEIYKTSGSHGCINLPLEMAKNVYEYVETGFPVVSYW